MPPRRKPNKESRSKEPVEDQKEDLRAKLREKLRTSQLVRKSRFARENRMDKLEEKLENSKNPDERRRLKKEIGLLEEVFEKEENFSGDYPEYDDTCTYGGSADHPN